MSLSLAGSGQISGFDAGLSGFGGLVAVKSAIFTGTQTNSTAGGGDFAVTDLSITHEVADPSNKLIISAFFGAAASSDRRSVAGIAINDGTSLIAVGTADGNRTQVTAGGLTTTTAGDVAVSNPSVTFVHTPGSGSKTYTVHGINVSTSTLTIYINRSHTDTNDAGNPRSISSLVIQEVKA